MKINNKGYSDIVMVDVVFGIIFFTLIVVVPIVMFLSKKNVSEVEAKLYNDKFHTNYTAHDFFWSGSTIKEYLNGDKQNTQNINGAIPVKITN